MEKLKTISAFKELKKFFSELSMVTSISGKLFLISSATGIVVGFAIILFNFILEHLMKSFEHLTEILPSPYLLILIPTLGGLLAGLIRYFSKTSFSYGCGTDSVIETIHKEDGHIKNKLIPVAGILSASMTIASGGSCGREGPASFIGTGFASITAYLIKKLRIDTLFGITLTKSDERIMGICGAAAGVGAIFRAPIGGAIFSTEVLYRYGFEFTALFPAILSSIISFTLFSLFYNYESLFEMQTIWSFGFSTILVTVIISAISSMIGSFYVYIFNRTHRFFRKLNLPDWIKPAIGGLIQGLLVYYVAKELWGIGYGTIQNTIEGKLTISVMCILLFGKMLSTSFTVASGGSGGLIAPSLFIGAMLGGIIGKISGLFFLTDIPIGIFVVLGMGALFSAVGKVPFALPLLIIEATRNMSLMLPLFIASTIGYVLSGKSTLYETQPLRIDLSKLGINVLGETEGSFIEKYSAKDIMIKDDSAISKNANLQKVAEFIKASKKPFFPVVGKNHNFLGIISFSEMKYIFSPGKFNRLILASELATETLPVITAQTSLKDTLPLFYSNNSSYLPVIDSESSNRFVGILVKNNVMKLLKQEMVKKASKFGIYKKKGITGKSEREDISGYTDNKVYTFFNKTANVNIKAKDKNGAITEMLTSLIGTNKLNNIQKVTEILIEREASATTGIGDGIAFPHIRTDAVLRPIISFGRSAKGIEYNAIDKKQVHMIFLILTPLKDGDMMLRIMGTLSGMLKYDEFVNALMTVENSEMITKLLKEWEEKA